MLIEPLGHPLIKMHISVITGTGLYPYSMNKTLKPMISKQGSCFICRLKPLLQKKSEQ